MRQLPRRPAPRGDRGTARGHRLGEQPAAAADVDEPGTVQRHALGHVIRAQRIDAVQGAELAVGVPPARRRRVESCQLRRVHVGLEAGFGF